jgi:hypothetical protein
MASFLRLPMSVPCPTPVLPGTPTVLDDAGEVLPLEDRTERCAVDAWWAIGGQPTCDVHLRIACEFLGVDFDEVIADLGGPASTESLPWEERYRYEQRLVVEP